jgi:hypothetical protein
MAATVDEVAPPAEAEAEDTAATAVTDTAVTDEP